MTITATIETRNGYIVVAGDYPTKLSRDEVWPPLVIDGTLYTYDGGLFRGPNGTLQLRGRVNDGAIVENWEAKDSSRWATLVDGVDGHRIAPYYGAAGHKLALADVIDAIKGAA